MICANLAPNSSASIGRSPTVTQDNAVIQSATYAPLAYLHREISHRYFDHDLIDRLLANHRPTRSFKIQKQQLPAVQDRFNPATLCSLQILNDTQGTQAIITAATTTTRTSAPK